MSYKQVSNCDQCGHMADKADFVLTDIGGGWDPDYDDVEADKVLTFCGLECLRDWAIEEAGEPEEVLTTPIDSPVTIARRVGALEAEVARLRAGVGYGPPIAAQPAQEPPAATGSGGPRWSPPDLVVTPCA